MGETAVVETITGGEVEIIQQHRRDRVCRLHVRRDSETIHYRIRPRDGRLVGAPEAWYLDGETVDLPADLTATPEWAREAVLELGVDEVKE